MKTGIIFPSAMDGAAVQTDVGGWTVGLDLANVLDIVRPSKIARAGDAGIRNFIINLPSKKAVDAVAIIGHNASTVATARVSGHFDVGAAGDLMYDSGAVPFWPAGRTTTLYRSIRLFVFPSTKSIRSIYIRLSANTAPWEIQAIEAGQIWEWPIGFDRELGVQPAEGLLSLAGGAAFASDAPAGPRVVRGQVDLMKLEESATTGLDFQRGLDIQRPFVFAEDFDDPSTWDRKCLLARNEEVPPMVGALYRRDRFPIRLIEHMR